MTNGKIRVSFEITDSFTIDGFRNYIKFLMSDDTKYEVYIISNDDTAAKIVSAGNIMGIPSDHVIICNFSADKIQAIQDNKIDIHFDDLQSFTMLVEETTEAYGILVTKNLNKYELRPDYTIVFERVVREITNDKTC